MIRSERGKERLTQSHNLREMHVCLLIFLTIITLGLYIPVWFLVKRCAINELQSSEKLGLVAPVFVIGIVGIALLFQTPLCFYIPYCVTIADYLLSVRVFEFIFNLLDLICIITIVVLSLKVRRIFIEHYNNYLQKKLKFSGIATFFFTIYYLQYKINRLSENGVTTVA